MYCSQCGNKLPENALFCSKCGAPLETTSTVTNINPNYKTEAITTTELPTLDFQTAIKLCLNNYFNFNGRSRRSEYWWFTLLGFATNLISIIPVIGPIISLIGIIVLFIPLLAVTSRRLHDVGRTGWWQAIWFLIPWIIVISLFILFIIFDFFEENNLFYLFAGLLLFIILIGSLIVFVYWLTKVGDKGPNKFGNDPRQVYESIHMPSQKP